MKTLTLTSPHTKSAAVKAAQARLVKAGYLVKGDADGEYGPITATAAKAAKWDLGYAAGECRLTYGQQLDDLLSGKTKPSAAMSVRTKFRKRQAALECVGAKAADRMVKWAQAGWKENPMGSNKVPQLMLLSKDLGLSSYLCNMGQAWCAQSAMTAALAEGSKTATYGLRQGRFNALYCPELKAQASSGSFGMRAVSKNSIAKGTMVLFDWPPTDGTMDHIGIALGKVGENVTAAGQVYKVPKNSICTVEGNASDAVKINVHDLSVVGFAFTIQ
jgi:hypothetical protein